MPLSGQQFTLRGRPAPSPGHICENNSAADWIAVLALVFEVFWSSFQPPQVVMVPAAQSCDWSELQMVSMAIERICAERTSGLGNELTATLLGNEPPLPGEGGGARGWRPAGRRGGEGMEACREKGGRGDGGQRRFSLLETGAALQPCYPPWEHSFPTGSAAVLVATEDANFKFLVVPNEKCKSERCS